jgi:pimeloyl-ACP methyl ester carboxylesterase
MASTEYEYRVEAGYDSRDPARGTSWSDPVVVRTFTRPFRPVPSGGACQVASTACDGRVRLPGGLRLKVYRSFPLTERRPEITRAVLVVHGVSRTAGKNFNSMVAAASAAGVLGETLIVSPHFASADGWGESWKEGGPSATFGDSAISSFAAADHLIEVMTDPAVFPNVREVVVAGHSAGGQFTQRYAATSSIESRRPSLRFRYVVTNPSSYVYLNGLRPSGPNTFATPRRCSSYNEYKYGLEARNTYTSRLSAGAIRDQYAGRYVVYLLGALDNDDDAKDLDESCEADLQGTQRLARGTFYFNHMMTFFPRNRHRRFVVGGVGHNRTSMFTSAAGLEALFE